MKICSIEGCGKTHESRGYCKEHYQQWYRYGDPLARNRQGIALADALLRSLPGGTVDVLLVELMRRRASLLAVPLVVRSGD